MAGEQKARGERAIMQEIEETLATIDGISTGDALKLGRLIQEYGTAVGASVMGGMINALTAKRPPNKPDWMP
jgi:hypothetical protein